MCLLFSTRIPGGLKVHPTLTARSDVPRQSGSDFQSVRRESRRSLTCGFLHPAHPRQGSRVPFAFHLSTAAAHLSLGEYEETHSVYHTHPGQTRTVDPTLLALSSTCTQSR